jgi:hypothetical protein
MRIGTRAETAFHGSRGHRHLLGGPGHLSSRQGRSDREVSVHGCAWRLLWPWRACHNLSAGLCPAGPGCGLRPGPAGTWRSPAVWPGEAGPVRGGSCGPRPGRACPREPGCGSPSGHDWRWCRVTDDAGAPRSGPGFDTTVSHSARIWNYRLGGKDNFSALLFCLPGLTCQNIASSCGNVPLADQLWVALTNAHQRSSPDFCLTFRALSGPAASGGVKATGPVSEPSGRQLR